MLPISADNRRAASVATRDEVDVELELDTEPREVVVQADLAAALDRDTCAQRVFDELSYSAKRRHTLSVDGAKTPETRQRRIDAVVISLRNDSSEDEPRQ